MMAEILKATAWDRSDHSIEQEAPQIQNCVMSLHAFPVKARGGSHAVIAR